MNDKSGKKLSDVMLNDIQSWNGTSKKKKRIIFHPASVELKNWFQKNCWHVILFYHKLCNCQNNFHRINIITGAGVHQLPSPRIYSLFKVLQSMLSGILDLHKFLSWITFFVAVTHLNPITYDNFINDNENKCTIST